MASKNAYDLTDKIFNKLTAKDIAKKDSSGHNYWRCVCECGNTVIARPSDLISGKIKMCNECKKKLMQGTKNINKKNDIKEDIVSSNNSKNYNSFVEKFNDINIAEFPFICNIHETNKNLNIFDTPIIYNLINLINADLCNNVFLKNEDSEYCEDMNTYFRISRNLNDLKNCEWEVGEVIYTAPVYNLLIREHSNSSSTYSDFYKCLENLKNLAIEHGNYRLSFPPITCYPKEFEWGVLSKMIASIFDDRFSILLF